MPMPFPVEKKLQIGILGGAGMLGTDLVKFFGERHMAQAITRENYGRLRGSEYDVLINANGNSRRFWANEHPLEDFEASTVSVYKSLLDFKFRKYVYISSSDVYPRHGNPRFANEKVGIKPAFLSPYGLHKYLSEQIVKNMAKDWAILRCSMMLGRNLEKGPIYDIMCERPLFVDLASRLQLITTREVGAAIARLIDEGVGGEIFNLGGRGAFCFKDVGRYFSKDPLLAPEAETQEYEMDVSKLLKLHKLKTSEGYLEDFLREHGNVKK